MAAWRIVVGISLIPAFGTLYQRLTLPESKRYVRSRQRVSELEGKPSDSTVTLEKDDDEIHVGPGTISPSRWTRCVLTSCFLVSLYIAHGDHEVSGFEPDADVAAASGHAPKAHISGESLSSYTPAAVPLGYTCRPVLRPPEVFAYFSEWRHAKTLIGTCMCWFLLDVAFYGINLNQVRFNSPFSFHAHRGGPFLQPGLLHIIMPPRSRPDVR